MSREDFFIELGINCLVAETEKTLLMAHKSKIQSKLSGQQQISRLTLVSVKIVISINKV